MGGRPRGCSCQNSTVDGARTPVDGTWQLPLFGVDPDTMHARELTATL